MTDFTNAIPNGVIQTEPLSPTNTFINAGNVTLSSATVKDYRQWAHSDIVGNTNRGALAEFIVGTAIGLTDGVRDAWAAYDLKTPSGIKVEVKSSAYLQSWYQKRLSRPAFGIGKSLEWVPETGEFVGEKRRQADVYVFCLLAFQGDKTLLDPLDLAQWEFYVVSSKEIDRIHGERRGHSLAQVRELSRMYIHADIAEAVESAVAGPGAGPRLQT